MSSKAPIHLSLADITEEEEKAVLRAVRSGWVAPLGPEVDAFEQEVADRVGTAYGVALSSGTAALHLGLLCLGVGPGDVVITSTLTFAATVNAIIYTGAEPFFVDSHPTSGNMDPTILSEAIDRLSTENKNVGAILPVDLLGKAADYTQILDIANSHEIPVLADAAESLGAHHSGKPAGSFGAAAAFSFNGNKIMTTSGGGMLVTNRSDVAEHARYLATQARQPTAHYEHTEVGFNYRMSNLLAAIGRAQLRRLDSMIARRQLWRHKYKELFAATPGVQIFGEANDEYDNAWLTAILVDESITGWSPRSLREHLAKEGIESRPLWKPMHLQPVFRSYPALVNGTAETFFTQGITLPSGSSMSDTQFDRVRQTIARFLSSPSSA